MDMADQQGRTSLMTAANYGQLATVKVLVKGGASLNLKVPPLKIALSLSPSPRHTHYPILFAAPGCTQSPTQPPFAQSLLEIGLPASPA